MAGRGPKTKVIKLDLLSSPYHITYRKNGKDLLVKRYEVEVEMVAFRDAPMEVRSHVFIVVWDADNVSVFRHCIKTFEDRFSHMDAIVVASNYAIDHMYAASLF
jgi:hypothetical protein